ncbi:MAG: TrkH family potassium uptake protein [Planctomycetota bacterium]|jgi:trk system potassium uptake protein TrkH
MNLGHVSRLLSGFTLFFTLSLVVPLAVSLGEDTQLSTSTAFGGAILVGLAVAALLWCAGRKSAKDFFRREGLATVGLAWFLAAGVAAIPFEWSGSIPSGVDAYFESVSGLTTTGATVLGTANKDIESLPASILLWRSMLQWMGGIGIILVFIVLLPGMGVTGSRLLSSEQVGTSHDVDRPRMATQARRLFLLYIGLTSAAALAYWVVGLPAFDALCHWFTTMATGGFSTNNVSVGGFRNVGVELVALIFMFIAGCNFLLVLKVLSRGGRPFSSSPLHRTEFFVYVGITLVVGLGVAVSLWFWGHPLRDESLATTHDYGNFGRCLRDGFFQTVSILTSTGYANADFEKWPKPALYLIFICMLIGGCTGSTAGGFKVLRVAVCARLAGHSLRQFVRPRLVESLRVSTVNIPDRVVFAVLGMLLLLWVGTVAAGALVLDLDPRLDLLSAFTQA